MRRVVMWIAPLLAAALAMAAARLADDSSQKPDVAPAAAVEGWVMPVPDQSYNVREGRALFHYYCATCHGEEGHGDGLNAYNLDPKPRNLSDPSFQKQRSDEELIAVIRAGGGVSGLSTGMPPWGRTIKERGIRDIVSYLRSLPDQKQ